MLLTLALAFTMPGAIVAGPAASGREVWHQIGPNPRPMEPSPLPIPRRKRTTEVPPPLPGAAQPATQSANPAPASAPARPATSRYARCLAAARENPSAAITAARTWLEQAPATLVNPERGAAARVRGRPWRCRPHAAASAAVVVGTESRDALTPSASSSWIPQIGRAHV